MALCFAPVLPEAQPVEPEIIQPLARIICKNSYTYIRYRRGKKALIYKQTEGTKTMAFEVFTLRTAPTRTFANGNSIPAREIFPRKEDFGQHAWTYSTEAKALAKFMQLEERQVRNA